MFWGSILFFFNRNKKSPTERAAGFKILSLIIDLHDNLYFMFELISTASFENFVFITLSIGKLPPTG